MSGAATAGPAATIGPAGGLTPGDLSTAYGFSSTATGTGQTVAIVDAYNDPDINADLQTFDAQYGLAACSTGNGCLKVVSQTGTTTLPPDDTSGWSVEESLDVETVHSVCQNCKIILLEATSNSNANLEAAEDEAVALKANEITNSFGGPETGSTAADEAAYNHPGTVITASAGDDGYYEFDQFGSAPTHRRRRRPTTRSWRSVGRRSTWARRPPASPRRSGTTTASRPSTNCSSVSRWEPAGAVAARS